MMKTTILTLICIAGFLLKSNGQVTLEATYDSASISLYIMDLEVSGQKYVKVTRDSGNRFIYLYNLNHTIWKKINCNSFPRLYSVLPNPNPPYGMDTTYYYNFDVLYVSENLFDLDNDVEFLFCYANSWTSYTGIYNEDGSLIFAADSGAPLVRINVPQVFVPIYNTPNGTKLILSFLKTGKAKVYSLQGILTSTDLINNSIMNQSLKIFPNPTIGSTTIEYSLPYNTTQGSIEIFDLDGKLIKSYFVDNSFNNIVIENGELQSGTYIYCLKANDKIVDSRQIIITR